MLQLRFPLLGRPRHDDDGDRPAEAAPPSSKSACSHPDIDGRCIDCDTSLSEHYGHCPKSGIRAQSWTKGGPDDKGVGRSKFRVEGVCCASEVPAVRLIVEPMEGVERVIVNPSSRAVFVDHRADVVGAREVADALTAGGFPARIEADAGEAEGKTRPTGIPTDVFVTSTLRVSPSSEDDDEAVDDQIHACLIAGFSEKQVSSYDVVRESPRTISLAIKHNPYHVTASGVADVLRKDLDSSIVTVVTDGGNEGMWAIAEYDDPDEDVEPSGGRIPVRWNVLAAGALWIVSLFSYIGGQAENLKFVAIASVALSLPPIALKGFKMLRRMHFDVNCMVLTAAVGALALQDYTESAAVAFLFSIGETLESMASARARNALSSFARLRPERANVINPITNEKVVLPASAVTVGMIVSVGPGDACPCDGIIKEGQSTIDKSRVTGQSRPEATHPGCHVPSGAVNTGSTTLLVETTATSNNSAAALRVRSVEEAQAKGSDTEKLIDSFAKIYTPSVAFLGICMCTIPWAFGSEAGRYWTKNGLVTIAIACPCPVVISTPCTYMAALAAVAQKGVLIKAGKYLEELGRVKSIAFDKTGTISKGLFGLLHFTVIGQTRTRKEVLGYLALMETPASHPLSNALVKAAANEQVELPKLQVQNHTLIPGEGITANIAGKDVHVGNRKLFRRLGYYDGLPRDVKATADENWEKSGGTVGFISIEGEGIVGAYCVVDEIRDEARDAVQDLKAMGVEIEMLTGDQRPAAISIGKQLGLEEADIASDLLPEEKMAEVADKVKENQQLREQQCCGRKRAVMMVGDGANDALALAVADISVAMGDGAKTAMDAADITLMDSDLNMLPYIVRMGRRVVLTIVQNVVFSLIVKAIVLGFAVAGRASLWGAVGSDVGSMLAVTLNGTRLLSSSEEGRASANNVRGRSYSEDTMGSHMSTEMSIHSLA